MKAYIDIDEWMHACMHAACVHEWIDGCLHACTYGCMVYRWMQEWIISITITMYDNSNILTVLI